MNTTYNPQDLFSLIRFGIDLASVAGYPSQATALATAAQDLLVQYLPPQALALWDQGAGSTLPHQNLNFVLKVSGTKSAFPTKQIS